MLPALIIAVDLIILILLLTRSMCWGLYWIVFTLPLYVARTHIGPLPTTLLEINILVIFFWWLVSRIKNQESRIKENIETREQENKRTNVIPAFEPESRNENKQKRVFFLFHIFVWIPALAGMTKKRLGGWFWIVVAWLIVTTISMLYSPNLREAAGIWKAYFIEPILFLIVFVDVLTNLSFQQKLESRNKHQKSKDLKSFLFSFLIPCPTGRRANQVWDDDENENRLLRLKAVFNTLITSGTVIAIIAIIQKFTGWWITNPFWQEEATRRVTSVFPFPNAVGLYLAPIAVMTLTLAVSHLPHVSYLVSCIMKNKKTKKQTVIPDFDLESRNKNQKPKDLQSFLFSFDFLDSCLRRNDEGKATRYGLRVTGYSIAFVLILLAILFARSRGALFGIAAGVLFLAFFHKGRRVWYWVGIICVTIFIALTGLGNELVASLQTNPATFTAGDSGTIRLELWQETLEFLKDHPLEGAGLVGFQTALLPYHPKPYIEIYKYPHNVFLNFWTELGLAGLVMLLLILVKFYWALFKSKSLIQTTVNRQQLTDKHHEDSCLLFTAYCLLAAMTALLVHGLVDVPYFKNDLSVLFWILVGISIILERKEQGGPVYGAQSVSAKNIHFSNL